MWPWKTSTGMRFQSPQAPNFLSKCRHSSRRHDRMRADIKLFSVLYRSFRFVLKGKRRNATKFCDRICWESEAVFKIFRNKFRDAISCQAISWRSAHSWGIPVSSPRPCSGFPSLSVAKTGWRKRWSRSKVSSQYFFLISLWFRMFLG